MTEATPQLITEIPNEDAVRVLALLLDHRRRLPDPSAARQAAQRLDALRASPDLLVAVDDEGTEASEGAPLLRRGAAPTEPELARAALSHLVHADPELAAVLPRAIALAEAPAAERLDPLTLGIAGLVLAALMTEVDWSRASTGQWKLRVHKRALQDATVATLIRGLFGTFEKHDGP